VDLAAETLVLPDGRTMKFPIDAFSKQCMLDGVDELGYMLQQEPAIAAYEKTRVGSVNTLG
jgi:3-isopropylmalate/(R)-2-methylmalate dehydratase small subunit